ncbi:MAG: DUF3427 domain-containing protein [Alicyclobacillus sp.]|nr:DUF3427 domain-containing protein [Alicyclobacillus sp.]
MDISKGIHEELRVQGKQYPEPGHRKYPVHPVDYAEALTLQLARDIQERLTQLNRENRFDEMIAIANRLRSVLVDDGPKRIDSPLHTVQYRLDHGPIPLYPGWLLTHPSLISNHGNRPHHMSFYQSLKLELSTADAVDFMVSFIRFSGIQLLIRPLGELIHQGRPIRILTSNYMGITDPKALRKILQLGNVQLKMFRTTHESFHTKAYLFHRASGLHTAIIGSSNLSDSALRTGYEWNVKIPVTPHAQIYKAAKDHFEAIWHSPQAIVVDEDQILKYESEIVQNNQQSRTNTVRRSFYSSERQELPFNVAAEQKEIYPDPDRDRIQPNRLQREALAALDQTRKNGFKKGVVIAATGTGKTYLSAFDVHQSGAKSMLFLAHRDELLEGAKNTFAEIFNDDLFGKLTGSEKEWEKPFLFSTVQTLSRAGTLERFAPDRFDYIVIDEFHHAQAETYRRVIEHFCPKFLLGLTATPERMDGRDVLELCDNNVVYEVRLREALEEGLLAPFHYFGLNDQTVNYDEIQQRHGQFDEAALAKALNTHHRVDYILEMINKFGHDGDHRVALGFCANVDHARYMCQEFNLRGYPSAVLTGDDSPQIRRATIQKLEDPSDPLEFIFTVDIFNEGIDIPGLNLVLFLRPTESATIFLQQLGRGLRKTDKKEFVTVLDFIGNYQKSFVVPLALSGQFNHRAFDKDSLRIAVETEFADLPAGCAVDLEPVSREQILKKIDDIRMNRTQMLMDLYRSFRKRVGHAPEITDFLYTDEAPSITYFISKFGSWVETKRAMDDVNDLDRRILADTATLQLVRALEAMLPLKWPYEFATLLAASKSGAASVTSVVQALRRWFGDLVEESKHTSHIERAIQRLSSPLGKWKMAFGVIEDGTFKLDFNIYDLWRSSDIGEYLSQRLHYGMVDFRRNFHVASFFEHKHGVVVHQNYTRNDLIFLFQANAQEGSWREGVSKVRNNYLLFINLNKDQDVAEHLQYHDYFIDNRHFHWQSQNQTSHASSVGQDYVHHKERNIHIHLFVRKFEKMHGQSLPFTYLGEVDYVNSHGDKPMSITWQLHVPVPDDLFFDFIR